MDRKMVKPVTCIAFENDGKILNLENFGKGVPLILEWHSKGEPPSIIFDFGEKVSGILHIKNLQPYSVNNHYGYLETKYGPQKDCLFRELNITSGDYFTEELFVGRYIELKISHLYPVYSRIQVFNIELECTEHPLKNITKFESDDELLNKIWKCGVRTVQLCIQPNNFSGHSLSYHTEKREWLKKWKSPINGKNNFTIFDGVRRDREMWVGDARWGSFTWLYAGGEIEPILNCFELIKELQEPDGELIISGFTHQKFIDYSLYFNMWLWEVYNWLGDINKIKPYYNCFKKNLDWILARLDNRGFYIQPKSNKFGASWMYSLKLGGIVTATQAILYGSLRASAKLLKTFDENNKANEVEILAIKLHKSINKLLYDRNLNIYKTMIRGNKEIKNFMHDSNVFCLNEGIPTKEKTPSLLDSIKKYFWTPYGAANCDKEMSKDLDIYYFTNWVHNKQIWCYTNVTEIEARFKYGDVEGALELTKKYYGNMIDKGSNTFWEMALSKNGTFPCKLFFADAYDSYCHVAAGRISYLLQAYILGIQCIKPGWENVLIAPQLGEINNVEGTVSTPKGLIYIKWNKKNKKYFGKIELPKGIKVFTKKPIGIDEIEVCINTN